MKNIGVFCSSLMGISSEYSKIAEELGLSLKKYDCSLIYGGGKLGLMGVVSKNAKRSGAKVVSVVPYYLNKPSIVYSDADEIIETKNLFERKKEMVSLSNIFVALPGGIGTYDEIFEVIAGYAMGEHEKPLFLVNTNNFWEPLLKMLSFIEKEGMIRSESDNIIPPRSMKNLYIVNNCKELFRHEKFNQIS
jgi:uncharacterized protein (TIGR00730 family)